MSSIDDPIVAEVRAARQELAERFADDIDALCDFLIAREREHEDRLVNYPSKPPELVSR